MAEDLEDGKTRETETEAFETQEIESTFSVSEALDDIGKRWRVAIIESGWSRNGVFYSPEVLQLAAPLFEGVNAFAAGGSDHSFGERGVRSIAGWFENVVFKDNVLEATFICADSGIRNLLTEAWKAHKKDLLGFSIRANANLRRGSVGRQEGLIVEKILEGLGVDVVMTPAAGGKILELLESKQEENNELEKEEDVEVTDKEASAEKITELEEALADANAKIAEAETKEDEDSKEEEAPVELTEAVQAELDKVQASRQRMDNVVIEKMINESDLPEIAQSRLTKQFIDTEFEQVSLQEAIDAEKDYLAAINPQGPDGSGNVSVGGNTEDSYLHRMDAMFLGAPVKVGDETFQPFASLREAYYEFTGENPYTGNANARSVWDALFVPYHSNTSKIEEALATGDWGQVFANRLNKRLLDEYGDTQNQKWRSLISDMTSLKDLEFAHRRIRTGGYGNFSTVAQQANYPEISSPTDEEVTYSPDKYGGMDTITWEMVLADDLGAIRRIPTSMARAMRRTQNEFFFDFLEDNASIYDGVTLFHTSSHGANSVAGALSVSTLSAATVTMRNQTAFGESAWILGEANLPKILVIPNELEGLAQRLVGSSDAMILDLARAAGTDGVDADTASVEDANRFRGKFDIVIADWFTDANDWFLIGNPSIVPTIEAGFLNGKDEPELWVQDSPTAGSMFSSDKITYKIRHVWGGAVLDFRPFYRGTN